LGRELLISVAIFLPILYVVGALTPFALRCADGDPREWECLGELLLRLAIQPWDIAPALVWPFWGNTPWQLLAAIVLAALAVATVAVAAWRLLGIGPKLLRRRWASRQ